MDGTWRVSNTHFDLINAAKIMLIKHQFTHIKRRIIASALLGVLMCTFLLPEQVYASVGRDTRPKLNNSLIAELKVETNSAIDVPNPFILAGQSSLSRFEFNSGLFSTTETLNTHSVFTRPPRKASLSVRICPKVRSVLDRKQYAPEIISYDFGDIKGLMPKSSRLFQNPDRQNPEINVYRGPPV